LNSLIKIFSAKAVLLIILFLSELIISQTKIALLYSGYTEIKTENTKKVFDEITSWELFLMENKIPYKVIYDEYLESGIEDDFDILILPSVEYISEQEFTELKIFKEAGKSIISAGSKLYLMDAYSNDLSNLEKLFNLAFVRLIDDKSKNYLHTLEQNTLNGFNSTDAGAIQITCKNDLTVYPIEKNNIENCGYLVEDNQNEFCSSIKYAIDLNSKYLWTGFGINDVVGGNKDIEKFYRLILDAIKWMDNKADAFINLGFDTNKNPAILLIENNNALEIELLDVINKNNINFHLVVSPFKKISDSLLTRVEASNLILNISYVGAAKLSNEDLINKILEFENVNSLKINSVFVNSELNSKEYLNKFYEKGIENIFINSSIKGAAEIINKDQIAVPISKEISNPLSNGLNSIYYSPNFNCKNNLEDSLLILIDIFTNKQNTFCSIDEYRNWKILNSNLAVKNLKPNENGYEIVVANYSTSEVSNAKLYLDDFDEIEYKNISVISNSVNLNHTFNQQTGLIEIEIAKMFPKSEKKIIVNTVVE